MSLPFSAAVNKHCIRAPKGAPYIQMMMMIGYLINNVPCIFIVWMIGVAVNCNFNGGIVTVVIAY